MKMNEYSKYKLFRKYITSNGVDYTPIDVYQAFKLNKDNQCDCGYRTYIRKIDGTDCRLNLNEDATDGKIIKEGNKYIIKPNLRTLYEEAITMGFYGGIKVRFKGNGRNVKVHYDIKCNELEKEKWFYTYYFFSQLDKLPILNTYYSLNNIETAMSYSLGFLPTKGDITFNVNDNEEHFFIIYWESNYRIRTFLPDEREEISLTFSENVDNIFFNAAGEGGDENVNSHSIDDCVMFQKVNILNQHALCPDDPNIDELVPNTTTYEILRKKSYDCGYLDYILKEKVRTVNYDEIPADYPKLTLVDGDEEYPNCLISVNNYSNPVHKIVKFKTNNNTIPFYLAKSDVWRQISSESHIKLDNYDLSKYYESLYVITLEGDENTIHTLDIYLNNPGNTMFCDIYLPFFNKGHFYDINQFVLSRKTDDGKEEIVAVDNYYFSNATEKLVKSEEYSNILPPNLLKIK